MLPHESLSSFVANFYLARWLAAQRSPTGAGGAREIIEADGFTIGTFTENGLRGTVPQWSAYDLGEIVVVLIDGMWTTMQAASVVAAAGLPPVQLPVEGVNAASGGDSLGIAAVLLKRWSGTGVRLLLGGYSYGGTIAEIVGVLCLQRGNFKGVEVTTFGSFRPGNTVFAAGCDNLILTRWMNDSDPLPRFPPHLQEAPAALQEVGLITAAFWQQYVQPKGGLVLSSTGSFRPLDVPTAKIPTTEIDLVGWILGADQGKVAGHSIQEYVARLRRSLTLTEQGKPKRQQALLLSHRYQRHRRRSRPQLRTLRLLLLHSPHSESMPCLTYRYSIVPRQSL